MGLINENHCLIEDHPEAFADKILALYQDKKLWNYLRENGLFFAEKSFGARNAYNILANTLIKLNISVPKKISSEIKLYGN